MDRFLGTLCLLSFTLQGFSQVDIGHIGREKTGEKVEIKLGKIKKIFEAFHSEEFHGAVLVAEEGEILYQEGFGLANREWKIENTPVTRFNIGSISKQFTAAIILQMVEEGKLGLQDKLADLLPYYRKDSGRKITIHHLLSHRSGIPNYTSLPGVFEDSLRNHYSLRQVIEKFCSGQPVFEPGSNYEYSNSGYLILAAVIEKVSGKPLSDVLHERVFDRFGLKDTGVDDREMIVENRASGYLVIGNEYRNANYAYMSNLAGVANIYATVSDLFTWNEALQGGQVVSPASLALMNKPYSYASNWIPPLRNGYGYGVGVIDLPDPITASELKMVFHSGHISGFSSYIAAFPQDGSLVVILSNIGYIPTTKMNGLALQVKHILQEGKEGNPKKSTP